MNRDDRVEDQQSRDGSAPSRWPPARGAPRRARRRRGGARSSPPPPCARPGARRRTRTARRRRRGRRTSRGRAALPSAGRRRRRAAGAGRCRMKSASRARPGPRPRRLAAGRRATRPRPAPQLPGAGHRRPPAQLGDRVEHALELGGRVLRPLADLDLAVAQRHVRGRRVGRRRVTGRDPVGDPGGQRVVDGRRDRPGLRRSRTARRRSTCGASAGGGAEQLVAAVGVHPPAVAVQVVARLVGDEQAVGAGSYHSALHGRRRRTRRRAAQHAPGIATAPSVLRRRLTRAARGSRRALPRRRRLPAAGRCGRSAGRAPTGSACVISVSAAWKVA